MSSILSELAKLVSKGMGEKLDKEIMQEVQMNEKLTAEQRVLQELIDYQREYKEQTQDYAPGNRYWADKFMTIIGKAKQALTAHTEPEDEWIPTKNADKYTNDYEPDGAGGMKVKHTEPEDGEKGLPKLIEEAHRLNNELTAVLIMLNKYKISAPSKE